MDKNWIERTRVSFGTSIIYGVIEADKQQEFDLLPNHLSGNEIVEKLIQPISIKRYIKDTKTLFKINQFGLKISVLYSL